MGLGSCSLDLWLNSIPILCKALVCSTSERIIVNIQKYRTLYCTVHVKPVQDMCNVSFTTCVVFLQKFDLNNSITPLILKKEKVDKYRTGIQFNDRWLCSIKEVFNFIIIPAFPKNVFFLLGSVENIIYSFNK